MVLDTFKKYPHQISSAFKRFPLASALAIFSTISFICSNVVMPNHHDHSPLSFWFAFYPIGAMIVALTTKLVQESQKSVSKIPQIVTGLTWLTITIALALNYPGEKDYYRTIYITVTAYFLYTTIFLSVFIAPFFKQKNENRFWAFLHKNLKALFIATGITIALTIATEGLIFGAFSLFDLNQFSEPYLYIFYFCRNTILPVLYFAGIPALDESLDEKPASSKFATGVYKLFIGVFSLYVVLLYAYIVKILIQWDLPRGTVSYLVSAAMVIMLLLTLEMYPAQQNPEKPLEKKLLKIFPIVCIPLVILMTFGIIRRISDYGISELRIYVAALNFYFYTIIAILLVNKIKCKFKYIAIVFCAILFVLTSSPFNAVKISRNIWMDSIKAALSEEGISKFPLNKDETNKFLSNIKDKSPIVYSRVHILQDRSKKELADFFETDSIVPDYQALFPTKKGNDQKKPRTLLHGSYSTDIVYDIPENAKQMVHIDTKFKKNEFEVRNDTIFFEITPKKNQKTFHFAFAYKARAPRVPCTPEQIENQRKRMGENFDETKASCWDTTFRYEFIDAIDGARLYKEIVHLDRDVVNGDTIYNFNFKGLMFMK